MKNVLVHLPRVRAREAAFVTAFAATAALILLAWESFGGAPTATDAPCGSRTPVVASLAHRAPRIAAWAVRRRVVAA